MREFLRDAVLAVAEQIPPGKVLSYGDIGQMLAACGPRLVGNVLSRFGSAVPWWRVVRADGTVAPGLDARALAEYTKEGTSLSGETGGAYPKWKVDMRAARWTPEPEQWAVIDGIAEQLREAELPESTLPEPTLSVRRDRMLP